MKRKYLAAILILGLYTQCIYGQAPKSTLATSISINNPDDRIHIYPNPSKGIFYFNGVRGNIIEVYDLLGQCVYHAEADKEKYPVDLSSHAKGIYSYRIMDEGAFVQQGKVVVN